MAGYSSLKIGRRSATVTHPSEDTKDMATKAELENELDAAHALLTERGVPIVTGPIANRLATMLDNKSDTEGDVAAAMALHNEYKNAEWFMLHGQLAPPFIDSILDVIKSLAKPWTKLEEAQQQMLIDSVSSRVKANLAVAMRRLSNADHPTIAASLIDFSAKGTLVKVKLEAVKSIENLTALGQVGAGQIQLIFLDQRVIDDGSAQVETKPMKDQLDLTDQLDLEPDDDTPALDGYPDRDLNPHDNAPESGVERATESAAVGFGEGVDEVYSSDDDYPPLD